MTSNNGNVGPGALEGSSLPPHNPGQSSDLNSPPRRRSARDYQFGTRIGEGSYSTVYSAVDLYDKKTYAVKILSKKHIVQEGKVKYVNIEKTTLHRLGVQHPGIVQLYYTFQDESSLFFVLDFAEYGELLSIISKFGSLSEPVSKFYMLQILDAVKFIHSKGVIHRDLKPENILVGYDFNLKITDFGAAKLLGDEEHKSEENITYDTINDTSQNSRTERKGSFVGTAEYVPPELLKYNVCGFETDIWAIGCILFQFFNGTPPFKGSTEYLTFEKIININYAYKEQVPLSVKEIISKVLVFEPSERPSIAEIQSMAWFKGVPWNNQDYIWKRKVPRFEPHTHGATAVASPPQFKTGANRNFIKSNSNYHLHSQISKFDNLVPSFGSKPSYHPATRLKKGTFPQNAIHQNSSPNIVTGSSRPPPLRPEINASSQSFQQNLPPTAVRIPPPSKHNQNAYRQVTSNTHLIIPPSAQGKPIASQVNHRSPVGVPLPPHHKTNSYIAAQQAPTLSGSLEQSLASTKISAKSSSPEMKDLRANTAFASLPKQSETGVKAPVAALPTRPVPDKRSAAPPLSVIKSANPTKGLTRPVAKDPVEITIKEISSFLNPEEKIIKLDCVLKSMLSNKLLKRKPGNLDDGAIEKLIEEHQTILDARMTPVIACISNKARIFLIDESLNVMMVNLTANKGEDYSMYDYEFESEYADDENGSSIKTHEDVFGYLILELIKEGGDLIFLKRFSKIDKAKYPNPIMVVGSSGNVMKIGSSFGWIDCLIWAKEMVEKDTGAKTTQDSNSKIASQHRAKSLLEKQAQSTRISRSGTGTKPSSNHKVKAGVKRLDKKTTEDRSLPESKKNMNKFAYAAAAAAHR